MTIPPATADEKFQMINRWRTDNWVELRKRALVATYYNGGAIPSDDPSLDPNDMPMSAGLGVKALKSPQRDLISAHEYDPGPIKSEITDPLDPSKSLKIQRILDKELNKRLQGRTRSLCRAAAGEFLVSGRAFAWCKSKWDIEFEIGTLYTDPHARDNIHSDTFWRWCFCAELKLSDIDNYLDCEGEPGTGWNREALRNLKRFVLQWPPGSDFRNGDPLPVTEEMLDEPIGHQDGTSPLHCYFCFEKSEERTGPNRKINLSILSRYGESAPIVSHRGKDGTLYKAFRLDNPKGRDSKDLHPENAREIYRLDDAFDEIEECLIPIIYDARITGDQRMNQVTGDGQLVLPRHLIMEDIFNNAAEGLKWATSPNFTAQQGSTKSIIDRIQANGIQPWDVVPDLVKPMDKSNTSQGARTAMEFISQLDTSTSMDSGAGNLPMNQGRRGVTQFAAEANQLVNQLGDNVSVRMAFWFAGWDRLWRQIGKRMCRNISQWSEHDPAYYLVKDFQDTLKKQYKLTQDEYDEERVEFAARRLPGGGDRQTAINKAMAILNNQFAPPQIVAWAWRNLIAALYDDKTADGLLEEPEQVDMAQEQMAMFQITTCLATGIAPTAGAGDNFWLHTTRFNIPALQNQFKAAQQAGQIAPQQLMGVEALLNHTQQDAQHLPHAMQQQVGLMLRQITQAFQQIPVAQAQGPEALKEQELQIKALAEQRMQEMARSLIQSRQIDQQRKEAQLQLSAAVSQEQLRQTGDDTQSRVEERKSKIAANTTPLPDFASLTAPATTV